jgi:hypothetical protein
LAEGKIITIIILHFPQVFIGIGGGGSWSRRLHSSRGRDLGISGGLLPHLLFFIGVAEDDHIAVTGQSEEVAVKVAKQSFDELHVSSSVSEKTFFV